MKHEALISQITHIRVEADETFSLLGEHKGERLNREASMAYTAFQRSRQWLGVALGVLGKGNPYPESTNPKNNDIAPPADLSNRIVSLAEPGSIKANKALRKTVEKYVGVIETVLTNLPDNRLYQIAITEAYISGRDAKMALGEDLGKMRDELPSEEEAPEVLNQEDQLKKEISTSRGMVTRQQNALAKVEKEKASLLEKKDGEDEKSIIAKINKLEKKEGVIREKLAAHSKELALLESK